MQLKTSEKTGSSARRVLVVDDEPSVLELIRDVVATRLGCRVSVAKTVREAQRILATGDEIDLLVTDVNLPDGDGNMLLLALKETQPMANAIVISGGATMNGAVSAMRGGAVDFLPKPFTVDLLTERVSRALDQQAKEGKKQRRMKTLRTAVRRLNEARKLVSRKVDLLCNDLIGAYSDLSRQFDTVRLQQGYREFIAGARDLEQLLCHTMDWLLRQLGYANVGIWLAADEERFNLGAYMKYTIQGSPALTEPLEKNLVRAVVRKTLVHAKGDELKVLLTPAELTHLSEQEVLAVNCTYLGDTLGVILLFRDAKTPFSPDDVEALKTVSPLFAIALTSAVKAAEKGQDEEFAGEATDEMPGDIPGDIPGDAPVQEPKKKPKKDPADWWKNGETPPF